MNYSNWLEKYRTVTNLNLDSRNPRINPSLKSLSQREIIYELIEHEKVYELAKNIVEKGYFPVESLVIIKENDKFVVVEGNRRLAALKLLIEPDIAPKSKIPIFRRLSNKINKNDIKKVKVIIAPSRDVADLFIQNKHTQSPIIAWTPYNQSTFFHRKLEEGLSINEISHEYNISEKDITDALILFTMYREACYQDLPHNITEIVENPKKFSVTTLKRLYEKEIVQQFLGIEFSNEKIVGFIAKEEFDKGYKKIISDIAIENINSRNMNKVEQIADYVNNITDNKPDLSKKDSFIIDPIDKKHEQITPESETLSKISQKRKAKKLIGLIPPQIICNLDNIRINSVFFELRKIKVASYPNAVAILFRTFLEMSISNYLEYTGHLKIIIDNIREKKKNKNQELPRDWHPTLSEMLKYIVNQTNLFNDRPNLIRALNNLISTESKKFFSIDILNQFVHNQYTLPDEDRLRIFWSELEELFKIILIKQDNIIKS